MKLIRIKAFPEAKKDFIEEVEEYKLRVFTRESAQNNRANKGVLLLISEYYEIPLNKLKILSGHKAQNKIIQILE